MREIFTFNINPRALARPRIYLYKRLFPAIDENEDDDDGGAMAAGYTHTHNTHDTDSNGSGNNTDTTAQHHQYRRSIPTTATTRSHNIQSLHIGANIAAAFHNSSSLNTFDQIPRQNRFLSLRIRLPMRII